MRRLAAELFGLFFVCVLVAAVFSAATAPGKAAQRQAMLERSRLVVEETALIARGADLPAAASGAELPRQLVWQGADAAAVEITMQQALVAITERHDIRLLAFGARPRPDKLHLPALGFEIEVSGGQLNILRFLEDIERTAPRLAVSELEIRQQPSAITGEATGATLQLALWGFWETGGTPP